MLQSSTASGKSDHDSREKENMKKLVEERNLQYAKVIEAMKNDPGAQTAIENLIFDASKFEARYEIWKEKAADSEKKKAEAEKLVLILQVRSRIEELERKFLLPHMIKKWTRYQKWDTIMRGDMLYYNLKKPTELTRFRSSVTMNIQELIDTVVEVYGELRDVAAHHVHYSVNYDENSVIDLLRMCKVTPDRSRINAIMTILRPIP